MEMWSSCGTSLTRWRRGIAATTSRAGGRISACPRRSPRSWKTTAGAGRCSVPAGGVPTRSPWPPPWRPGPRRSSRWWRSGPAYWQPAHFASAAATLDHLSGGRLLVNIVSGQDNLAAYGDVAYDQPERYARTREFLQLVRLLWTRENVTYRGRYFGVSGSTVTPRPRRRRSRRPRRTSSCSGGAAGRRRGADRAAYRADLISWPGACAAGVRAADHHTRQGHQRGSLARRRG